MFRPAISLGMTVDPEIEFTVATFTNLLRDNKRRHQRALQLRHEAHESAEHGDENYRIEWLKQSVRRVLDALEAIAIDFNVKHLEEACTTEDFKDILASALKTLGQV